MALEVKRFEFEGKPLTLTQRDGEWWANGDEVAAVLGYSDKRKLNRLYREHRAEFLPSEVAEFDLRKNGPKSGPNAGNLLNVRLYSLRGVEHVAILGRTETGICVRRWVLDLLERLRGEQMAAFEARVAALEARDSERESIELELLDIHERSGRALARAFAARANHPRVKGRLEARRADLNDLEDTCGADRRGCSRLRCRRRQPPPARDHRAPPARTTATAQPLAEEDSPVTTASPHPYVDRSGAPTAEPCTVFDRPVPDAPPAANLAASLAALPSMQRIMATRVARAAAVRLVEQADAAGIGVYLRCGSAICAEAPQVLVFDHYGDPLPLLRRLTGARWWESDHGAHDSTGAWVPHVIALMHGTIDGVQVAWNGTPAKAAELRAAIAGAGVVAPVAPVEAEASIDTVASEG